MNAFAKVRQMFVFLAADEWGNEAMYRIAENYLRADNHPNKATEPLVMTVYEHAGWHLDFALIDDKVVTVGTANDAAVFNGKVKEFRDAIYNAKWEVIESGLRRDNDPNLTPFADLCAGDRFDYCGFVCRKINESEYLIAGDPKPKLMESRHDGRSKNVIKLVE